MPDEPTPPEEPTPDEPQQDALKVAMLEEVHNDLPPGIADFLLTPLPAKATLTAPVDVDSAIICQAQFCVFLNDLFGAYEGLTPIQIPMFMAQLNTVQQGMLLASLEAAEPTPDTPGLLTVTGPLDGGRYKPGELRVTASADKKKVRSIEAALNDGDAFSLRDVDGDVWRNYLDMSELGDYTLTVTATLFEDIEPTDDMGPLEQTIAFSIADDAEDPAEGADIEAFNNAVGEFEQALRGMMETPLTSEEGLKTYMEHYLKLMKKWHSLACETGLELGESIVKGGSMEVLENLKNEGQALLDLAIEKVWNIDESLLDGKHTMWDALIISNPVTRKLAGAMGSFKSLLSQWK